MNIDGWEYPYETLQRWNWINRDDYHAYDLLFENEQSSVAILIYSVIETRMSSYEGFLAILRDKDNPQLILQTKCFFKDKDVIFSSDGRFALATASVWNQGWPIIIFDLVNQRFSSFVARTNDSSFYLKENRKNEEFIILAREEQQAKRTDDSLKKLDGTKIRINELKWRPFGEVEAFCQEFQ